MAGVKLRDSGFTGRILDSASQDFQDLLRRFSEVAERRARYIVLPSSAQDTHSETILTTMQPIMMLNFTGVGDPDRYNDVWTSFREAAKPSVEQTVGNLSVSDLSHSFDDALLKGPPRVLNAGCVVTDLWPEMAEELWESFITYTTSNPDVVDSMVALEFHATRRKHPELSCFPIDEPVHHAIVVHDQHHTSASDQGAASSLNSSTSIIRRHQTRNTGKDLGLAANATSIPANPRDVWGKSYERLRVVKTKYDPNSVFNKFHPIEPTHSKSKISQQPEVGENGRLHVRESL
ncbi:hypothetical protein FJTKL_02182 [Diaporthe vaccinii]|uniref:Berberine/berberine-like domain-containing protein n=1 Tax=Diaporthe vaccinii TaxID=105482 RepID=A0ABR4DYK7_9PEZI